MAALVPHTEDTFAALSDPARRPPPTSPQMCVTSQSDVPAHSQMPPSVRSSFVVLQAWRCCWPLRRIVRTLQNSV